MLCYFCGEFSAIVSLHDRAADVGRVEVYCTNSDCEAREMTVLVMKDGTRETAERSDVRVLRMIDDPSRPGRLRARRRGVPEVSEASAEDEWLVDDSDEVVARRRSPGVVDGVDEVGASSSEG
ncbi:hypothetical protein ACFXGA_27005 [Actinosynnema sp. NPDC059335]|uniref:hypothetical protein n=1 Tax=Actinosynnema sp. NPDC059335 TaxID=3346804 RepID=UPI00366F2717